MDIANLEINFDWQDPKTRYLVYFVALVVALILLFVVYIKIKNFLIKIFKPGDVYIDKKYILNKWAEIEKLMQPGTESGYKLAILEADKLLDYALKAKLLPGQNLGERLKIAVAHKPELRIVWPAHIVRNKIAHDADFTVGKNIATESIKQIKKALIILGIL